METPNATRVSDDQQHDDLEMLAREPPTSGAQKKKKQHSPTVYRNCPAHEDTPRRSVWAKVGHRNKPSVKSRLDWQQTTFDRNRLGPRNRTQTEMENSKKKWSKWVVTGKYGIQKWYPDVLNQTDVPGYHNKNRNGTANGTGTLEGKDPTPSVGHLTAKTKTLMN